ncbi:MAG TPA: hypothetical protein DEB40_14360 [Elusimicrobia bacterium]|nr:hypothetical protein [Elusimicrobiota bacterium]HBT62916.1 hypothetical protein [Elusimicrobiota bacterium]
MRLNLLIDAAMLLLMAAISGIGILMKRVLITGQERWSVYGRNVDISWLGLDRHEWGDVHLVLGCFLLGLLVWHLLRHWNSVVGMVRQLMVGDAARRMVVGLFAVIGLGLMIFPFFINPEVTEIGRGEGRQVQAAVRSVAIERTRAVVQHGAGQEHSRGRTDIRGSMTLGEVSGKYGVSAEYLKNRLGLPAATSGAEKLGDIRRKSGIRMSEVQSAVEDCGADDHACRPK